MYRTANFPMGGTNITSAVTWVRYCVTRRGGAQAYASSCLRRGCEVRAIPALNSVSVRDACRDLGDIGGSQSLREIRKGVLSIGIKTAS